MQILSRGQIISIILLAIHFVFLAIFGVIFIFSGPILASLKPGDELFNQMVRELESNPEFMALLKTEDKNTEAILVDVLPMLGTTFTIVGALMFIISIISLLSAIFIYKGKNWSRYLSLVSVIFGMLIPGILVFLSIFGILLLVGGGIIIYLLFFDKETAAVFDKTKSEAEKHVEDNAQKNEKGKQK
ncbi:MAG: hypothetical protein N3F05_01605 [Candidatus Diapherotrites archaeon]|nr:hypothetical protein [Candidatus Diapherotrites archaeon]